VFVRGHLRHYAELVGEKTAELLDLYGAASQPVLPDLTKLPKASPESNPSRLAVPALVVLIGFVLLGVVWWVIKSVGGPQSAGPKRGPQPVAIAPELPQPTVVDAGNEIGPSSGEAHTANEAAATADTAAANGRAAVNASSGRSSIAGGDARPDSGSTAGSDARTRSGSPAGSGARSGNPSPAAVTSRSDAGAPSQSAGSVTRTSSATSGAPAAASAAGVSAPAAASAPTAPAAPRGDKPMEVTLRFAADSWVEVYDAKGEKLFYDVGTADSSRTVSGTPPFRVHVANAPGVTLDVNGKPATVPANAVKGDEAQFVINRSGRIVRARPQADGG
jgi:cytoskeletal protein RodZ